MVENAADPAPAKLKEQALKEENYQKEYLNKTGIRGRKYSKIIVIRYSFHLIETV